MKTCERNEPKARERNSNDVNGNERTEEYGKNRDGGTNASR